MNSPSATSKCRWECQRYER